MTQAHEGERLDTDKVVSDLPNVSALEAAKQPRHRWYFFKEGFSPALVDAAIDQVGCSEQDVLTDPFCGSGTVPLQAALRGRPSVSREVNPFLAFVSRTKLLDCKADRLLDAAGSIVSCARSGRTSCLEGYSTFTEVAAAKKWLFNLSVLRAFEGGRTAAAALANPERDLCQLALIGAAMDVGNAVKDGKCLRYRRDWEERKFDADAFVAAFEARIEMMVEDLEAAPIAKALASVVRADSRSPAKRKPRRFRLCITSPPYLNSFDYTDVYRPELFLGRWVASTAELRQLRFETIRSHVQVEWPLPVETEWGPLLSDALEKVSERRSSLWSGRIPWMIQAYFEDMKIVLDRLRSEALDNASVWLVVSTSSYAGVEIPVDLILADLAVETGWHLRSVKVLRYLGRVPGQQWAELSEQKDRRPHLRESLVVLDASAG